MFLKFTFLFIFLFWIQGQANPHVRDIVQCAYGSSEAYKYEFDSGEVEKRVVALREAVQNSLSHKTELFYRLQENLLRRGGELPVAQSERVELKRNIDGRTDNSNCPFKGENSNVGELFRALKRNCSFQKPWKKCKKTRDIALIVTCGEKGGSNGCNNGLYQKAKDHTTQLNDANITPDKISLAMQKRNDIAQKLVELKDGKAPYDGSGHYGYKQCAEDIKENILTQKDGAMLCLETYDTFFNNRRKELATENCTNQAIETYLVQLKEQVETMNKEHLGPQQLYEQIKNNHVMARLCTLKLLDAFKKLDSALDSALKKQTTSVSSSPSSSPRQTAGTSPSASIQLPALRVQSE